MASREFEVPITSAGERLDIALLRKIKEEAGPISRAELKEWFSEHRVRKGSQVLKPSSRLSPGMHTIRISPWRDLGKPVAPAAPESFQIPVVYEDEAILALNKPSGIHSLPHSPDETSTAVGFALARATGIARSGRSALEPGLLHRLDTGTSGLLLFAKTQKEFERLRGIWKKGPIRKIYRALVSSESPPAVGLISTPLAHDAKSAKKMIALTARTPKSAIRGKPLPARTRVQSVRQIAEGRYELEIEIETGVMHQIRCHLSSRGWPVLGDTRYQGPQADRIWLHSWRMRLPLSDGKELWLQAGLPASWPGA